jgi:endonuclease/exonuclease/phosphatase family metal-dependent hydrolase
MPALVLLIWSILSALVRPFGASEPAVVAYRNTVGPPIVFSPPEPHYSVDPKSRLIVVNWNVHVGHGDVIGLIDKLSSSEKANGFGNPEFVLLLEESFRQAGQDKDIPDSTGVEVPGRIAPPDPSKDIAYVARKMGWWLYYAPSMRNGDGTGEHAEDRGNAILSSLPLEHTEAVELPFAVQRRVALIATVSDGRNQPKLRVAVTHFDTRAPLLQGWIFGGPAARNKQAKDFVTALKKFDADRLPIIVGGDLNTYMGSKAVIDTMSGMASHTDCGTQATHTMGVTLDHIFATVPEAWPGRCVRGDTTFGSDHYPLVFPLNVSW